MRGFRYDGMVTDFESSSMRVSDADRESAMTALGEHMSTGRLSLDEYGDRSALVSTAKTRHDLLVPFEDLPEPWPKISGVDQVAATPVVPTPVAVARRRGMSGWVLAPLVPVVWVAAIVVGLATGYWVVFLIPLAFTILGAVLLGRGVRRVGQRVAGNLTEATGFTGWNRDWAGRDYRDEVGQARQDRDVNRNAARWERRMGRYGWQAEVLGQIGAEIQRGMRGAYGRGGYDYRRRHHHHHGRRHHRW
jgi:hypothetical protein